MAPQTVTRNLADSPDPFWSASGMSTHTTAVAPATSRASSGLAQTSLGVRLQAIRQEAIDNGLVTLSIEQIQEEILVGRRRSGWESEDKDLR